jgi:hypothetical protein
MFASMIVAGDKKKAKEGNAEVLLNACQKIGIAEDRKNKYTEIGLHWNMMTNELSL